MGKMVSSGMVRKIDELGRVVIPKSLRNTLDIKEFDSLEILVEGENIVLRKYQKGCVFCGSLQNNKSFKGKLVCEECLEEMK